jgi:glycerol dehydrogenase-like iron-containing ADH family enzyme
MANLNQVDFCYRGAIENLSEIVKFENTKKVLIFTGKKSYENIKNIIEDSLQGVDIQYYNDFSINPKDEEIKIKSLFNFTRSPPSTNNLLFIICVR